MLAPLDEHEVERPLGGQTLPDQRLHARAEFDVHEDRHLHVEDRGLGGTRLPFRTLLDRAQPLDRGLDHAPEPRHLRLDLMLLDDARPDLGHLPEQQVG